MIRPICSREKEFRPMRRSLTGLDPERVCVIKPSALGDVCNATPAFAALRALWPEAHFSWVINTGLRGLVDGLAGLDEVIPFDRKRIRASPSGLAWAWKFGRELARQRFDVVIDLQGLLRSGLMSAATRAPIRVGLSDAREGATRFYTHRVPMPAETTHAVDRLLRVAAAFGADIEEPRFQAAMTDADRDWADAVLRNVPGPRVGLNLGARWITKRWPPEKFAEIGRRAADQFGAGLVALGAPEDRPLIEALTRTLEPTSVLDLSGRTTLPQLAAVCSRLDLMVSNDTGPLHLAVAAGTRSVGIYTCTDPAENGPYGPRSVSVRTKVECAGSYLQNCPTLHCMDELTVERVWRAVAWQLRTIEGLTRPEEVPRRESA
jgi:lipopolysaccharide heptosyltransferase I